MDVIWHDHKTTNRDATWLALSSELNELPVNSCIGEQSFPAMGVKRHKVQRWIVFLENEVQARRSIGHKGKRDVAEALVAKRLYNASELNSPSATRVLILIFGLTFATLRMISPCSVVVML